MAQLLTLEEIWKVKHLLLYEAKSHDAIRLRMHRAFSWMPVPYSPMKPHFRRDA